MTSRVTVDDSTVPSNTMRRILPHPLTQTLALSRGVWYTKTAGETYKRERIGHHQGQRI